MDKSVTNSINCFIAYFSTLGVYSWLLLCILTNIEQLKNLFYFVANLNNGIVMTILASKPIFSSIAFYFLFNQRLKMFELCAVLILIVSVILIGFSSNDSQNDNNNQNVLYIIISMLLLTGSTLLVSFRTVLMKYFLAYGDNQVDISAFSNIYSLVQNLIMFTAFIP